MTVWTSRWTHLKVTLLIWGTVLWFPLPALAADTGADWRSTYDVVMMWVNFVILAALLYKFLRKPLGRFLTSQREAIKKSFDTLEAEKARIQADVQALQESLAARKQRAEDLHRRIIEQARAERIDIIAAAQEEAQRRLTKARQQIDARHREVYHKLRNEIIDKAVGKVMKNLPGHMTAELQQDLTDRFLTSVTKSKP